MLKSLERIFALVQGEEKAPPGPPAAMRRFKSVEAWQAEMSKADDTGFKSVEEIPDLGTKRVRVP